MRQRISNLLALAIGLIMVMLAFLFAWLQSG
jgi:hypothetical protein